MDMFPQTLHDAKGKGQVCLSSLDQTWVSLGAPPTPSLFPSWAAEEPTLPVPGGVSRHCQAGRERLLLKEPDLLHSLTFLDLAFTTSGFYSKEAFCI